MIEVPRGFSYYLHSVFGDAKDSRIFGPLSVTDIVGRVIYCLRTAIDHGPVLNSPFSMKKDAPVLQAELDVDEMSKNQKA